MKNNYLFQLKYDDGRIFESNDLKQIEEEADKNNEICIYVNQCILSLVAMLVKDEKTKNWEIVNFNDDFIEMSDLEEGEQHE